MPLQFIGAGMHPDSTNVTGATTISGSGRFIFLTGASGSSFTGIHFDPSVEIQYGNSTSDDDPENMIFERCSFQDELKLSYGSGCTSSSSFNECIFFSKINGSGGAAATFDRCVFPPIGSSVTYFTSGGLIMRNSIMLGGTLSNSVNAVVQNCIFTRSNEPPLYQMNGTQITNCIISYGNMFSGVGSGNVETNTIYGQLSSDIFVNETDNIFQFTDDLHLLPGSPGINAGNDGTDIGIYGTGSPSKLGNVPFNPHFQAANVAISTDANGDLPVIIRAAAQPN